MQNTTQSPQITIESGRAPKKGKMKSTLVVITGLVLVIVALALTKASQIGKLIAFGEAAEKAGPPPVSVSSTEAKLASWQATGTYVGSVEAGRGVTISSEAAGTITAIHFESGTKVEKGAVLVEIDSSVERAQLTSALARKDLATTNLARTKALVEANAVSSAEFDANDAQRKTALAEVATLEAQIAKKLIRAPFSGTLGIRAVNIGQYLNPGTPITVLQSNQELFVDFAVPQQQLSELKLGGEVNLRLDNSRASQTSPQPPNSASVAADSRLPASIHGVIAAIDPTLDPVTRSIHVRATTSDKDKYLRPGMFVTVDVILPTRRNFVLVPKVAVVHAPYGDSLFVIEEKKDDPAVHVVRQQFVRVGEARGDFVAIEDGLKGGEQIVSAGAFKLKNQYPVVVDNSIGLMPALNPKVENR